ncbi:MAG: crAss001_48 related protein [Plesiomonas shigelloides]
MDMQDWQKRVIEEQSQLGAKAIKLADYISSDEFNALDEEEQMLLRKQRDTMVEYWFILERRIGLF